MFYQTYTAHKPPQSPLAGTQWCHPLLLHAVCSKHIPFVCFQGATEALSAFFVPGDLDL